MKIGLITDTHYGVRNDNQVFYPYQEKSNEYYFRQFEKHGVEVIIHPGDLMDRRKYLNFVTAQELEKSLLDRMTKYPTHIICGNHDVYYKNTNEINSLNVVLGKYDFNVYTGPQEIELGGTKILLLPWINQSNQEESVQMIKDTTASICIGHLEIAGFEMHTGSKCEHGLDYSLFEKFNLVISGHFHHRSHYGPVNYIGAAYEYTWADFNDPRGVSILDTETLDLTFIQNPYTLFKVYRYDDVHAMETIQNDLEKKDFSKYKDCYVKVLVENKEHPYTFDMILDALHDASPANLKIAENMNYLVDEMDEIDEVEDTKDIMDKYIDAMGMEQNKSKRVKSLMHELYQEAISLENVE